MYPMRFRTGWPRTSVPPSGNFSLPYADDFDDANGNEALPKFFADQGGSFAITNGALSQRAPMPPGKNGSAFLRQLVSPPSQLQRQLAPHPGPPPRS